MLHTHKHTHILAHSHKHAHTHTHKRVHTHKHTVMHTNMCTHTCIQTLMHTNVHTLTHTVAHVHTHTLAHMHAHAPSLEKLFLLFVHLFGRVLQMTANLKSRSSRLLLEWRPEEPGHFLVTLSNSLTSK